MIKLYNALFGLINIGVNNKCEFSIDVIDADWQELFELACKQGVCCITWSALEIMYKHEVNYCPVEIKLNWYAHSEQIQKKMSQKMAVCFEFAEKMQPVKLVALKGLDYARLWPKSEWREFGDFDCVAINNIGNDVFKRVSSEFDALAVERGCKFEDGGYKHSHLFYNNLLIENHHNFTRYGTDNLKQQLEKDLCDFFELVHTESFRELNPSSNILSPNANFTAVYMLAHAQNHFFYEGLNVRHILDWHFFLTKEGGNVDWKRVENVMERTKLKSFAVLLTQICKTYFGLRFNGFDTNPACKDELVEKFLDDIFSDKYNDHDRRWWMMIARMMNRFKRMWIFREFLIVPFWKSVIQTFTLSSFMHVNPELKY